MLCLAGKYHNDDAFPAVINILRSCMLRYIKASNEEAVFFLWFNFCHIKIFTVFYKEN